MNEAQTNQSQPSELMLEAPKKYKCLDTLLRNPIGYPIDKLVEGFDISDSGIRSMIGRIRNQKKPNYQITIFEKKLTTKVNGHIPTQEDIDENIALGNEAIGYVNQGVIKRMQAKSGQNVDYRTMKEKAQEFQIRLANLLSVHPQGISINEICEKFECEKQYVYNVSYSMRKKGINIISNNGIYRLIHGTPKETPKSNSTIYEPQSQPPALIQTKSQIIPPEYSDMFNRLPDSDKIDCIDMLKKSLYYKKSALALIESNQIALNFCKTLSPNGGAL